MKTKKNFFSNFNSGFTLVEIMVVFSIFALLGSVMLDTDFNSRKRINALTTDMESLALEIIEMQNRTLSFVINPDIPDYNGYGVYIDLAEAKQIQTFYKTVTLNNVFSSGNIPVSSGNNPNNKLPFDLGNRISKVILYSEFSSEIITANSPNKKIAIFFTKPKPYTNFYFGDSGSFINTTADSSKIIKACLEMSTGQGNNNEFKHLDIFYVGQISQSAGKCP